MIDVEPVEAAGSLQPQSLKCEQAFLGCLILDHALIQEPHGLTTESFYYSQHALVFRAMLDLAAERRPLDVSIVDNQMQKIGQPSDVGYLAGLVDQATSTAAFLSYAEIVRDRAARRSVVHASNAAMRAARDLQQPITETIASTEVALAGAHEPRKPWATAREAASEYLSELEDSYEGKTRRGFKTGLDDLDRKLFVRDTDFIIVGARPGDGKTTWLWNCARYVAATAGPIMFVSIEMPRSELTMRAVQDIGSLAVDDARKPRNDDASKRLVDALESYGKLPITFVEENDPLLIFREALRLKRKIGLRAVFLDYVQLVKIPRDWGDNRDQRLGEFTRRARAFAKDECIPFVAAAQLKRRDRLEKGVDPRPSLEDLRESGNLEQDATSVLFLYRPGMIAGTAEFKRNDERTTELLIAKQRSGAAGTRVDLVAEFEYARFAEREAPVQPELSGWEKHQQQFGGRP